MFVAHENLSRLNLIVIQYEFDFYSLFHLSRYLRMDARNIYRAAIPSDTFHKNKCFCNRNFTSVQLKKKCFVCMGIYGGYRKKVASSAGYLMVDC